MFSIERIIIVENDTRPALQDSLNRYARGLKLHSHLIIEIRKRTKGLPLKFLCKFTNSELQKYLDKLKRKQNGNDE